MKKIALYIPTMDLGGAEKVFMILANEFSLRGYEVDLLLTVNKGVFLKDLSENVNIVELSKRRVFFDFFKLRRYLKHANPDVIVSGLTHCNLMLGLVAILCGFSKRTFVTEHSNFVEKNKENNIFEKLIFNFLISWIYPKLSGVICVSNGVRVNLIQTFPSLSSKSTYIYNPFDIDYIKAQSNQDVVHPWLIEDKNFKTIISSGRLTPAKDFETLLKAFLILKCKKNVRLIILGEGEMREKLTDFINSNDLGDYVDLYGFDGNPFRFISRADLFVSSSKREGLSNVLVESMICNTPVVSTNCPSGPAEILEDGLWGDLVCVGDYEALADAIYKNLFNNQKELDYSLRVKTFASAEIANEYLDFFSSNTR